MNYEHRYVRYFVLLLVLFAVIVNEVRVKSRVSSWEQPLIVHIYALSGDATSTTGRYIQSLQSTHFDEIQQFVNSQARRYGVDIEALRIEYKSLLETQAPQAPNGDSILENIFWSLHFRAWSFYWTFMRDSSADINLFVNYFDPVATPALRHSVGLRSGMIALVNGFSNHSYDGSNNTVIVHELMHTLGATDKYGAANMPIHPRGYADPFRAPLYPQTRAEIMGGRIPVNPVKAVMPRDLSEVVVGVFTAAELNWPVDR